MPMIAAPPGPRPFDNGDGVADLCLQVREPIERYRVREPGASPVEVDQPAERAEPPQDRAKSGKSHTAST